MMGSQGDKVRRSSQLTSDQRSPTISQFTICLALAFVLLFLLAFGRWRSTATGPQVQVPMFYDAHYLFPRPWTQAQEAPGVPDPFPVAFYGPNTISQTFVSGANNLAAVELWLQAPPDGHVAVTFSDEAGPLFAGQVDFSQQPSGEFVRFAFRTIREAKGGMFQLTLAAPEATADNPAITHVIGGDRLGGALRLNEYPRPGNLELRTYVTGTAVWDALAEQLLPDVFRQRLRQYKPSFLKGETFSVLLALTAVLSVALLIVARPATQQAGQAGGRLLVGLLLGGLVWQVGGGRVHLPFLQQSVPLKAATAMPNQINNQSWRVVNDLSAILWTAERLPEKRFVTSQLVGYPAVRVPAASALEYALDLPVNGRLRTGLQVEGDGVLLMSVDFNGEVLTQTIVAVGDTPHWLDLDLTPWQGQGGVLRLVTEPLEGRPDGLWLMPQLLAKTDWLLDELPPTAVPAGHRLGEQIVLLGYAVEPAQPQPQELVTVTVYWRRERPLTQNATVFVHALNTAGEMVAQSDSQPVQNSYPLNTWPSGFIIADSHQFVWPANETLSHIAVGLYDPTTLARYAVLNPDSRVDANAQALLPVQGRP